MSRVLNPIDHAKPSRKRDYRGAYEAKKATKESNEDAIRKQIEERDRNAPKPRRGDCVAELVVERRGAEQCGCHACASFTSARTRARIHARRGEILAMPRATRNAELRGLSPAERYWFYGSIGADDAARVVAELGEHDEQDAAIAQLPASAQRYAELAISVLPEVVRVVTNTGNTILGADLEVDPEDAKTIMRVDTEASTWLRVFDNGVTQRDVTYVHRPAFGNESVHLREYLDAYLAVDPALADMTALEVLSPEETIRWIYQRELASNSIVVSGDPRKKYPRRKPTAEVQS